MDLMFILTKDPANIVPIRKTI